MADSSLDLWQQTTRHLDQGNFTALEGLLNDAGASIINLLDANDASRRQMEEALTWACFVGHVAEAQTLLDRGIDPAAGTATGLAAFHWAANRGRVEVVRLLIKRRAPLEQKNIYDGTVLNSTLWSAVHEHHENHAQIIEELIAAGAEIGIGFEQWWEEQNVPSAETKTRVREALRLRPSDTGAK